MPGLRLSYWNPRLLRTVFFQLQQQQQAGRLCDVTLQGDGEGIHVHSCVIAACSPYLANLLMCPTEILEASDPKTPISSRHVLWIHGIKSLHLLPLVHYMYTSELEVAPTDVSDVLKAAKKLQIPELELLKLEAGRLIRTDPGRRLNRNCLGSKTHTSYAKADKQVKTENQGILNSCTPIQINPTRNANNKTENDVSSVILVDLEQSNENTLDIETSSCGTSDNGASSLGFLDRVFGSDSSVEHLVNSPEYLENVPSSHDLLQHVLSTQNSQQDAPPSHNSKEDVADSQDLIANTLSSQDFVQDVISNQHSAIHVVESLDLIECKLRGSLDYVPSRQHESKTVNVSGFSVQCSQDSFDNVQGIGGLSENVQSIGKLPEDGQGVGELPEDGQGVGELPEDGQGVGELPEDGQGVGELPEDGQGVGELPEDGQGVGELPEDGQGVGELPEDGQGVGELPEDGQGVGELPEDGQGVGELPEDGQGVGELPEDGQGVGELPEDGQGVGELPEDGQSSGELPEDGQSSGESSGGVQGFEESPDSVQRSEGLPENGLRGQDTQEKSLKRCRTTLHEQTKSNPEVTPREVRKCFVEGQQTRNRTTSRKGMLKRIRLDRKNEKFASVNTELFKFKSSDIRSNIDISVSDTCEKHNLFNLRNPCLSEDRLDDHQLSVKNVSYKDDCADPPASDATTNHSPPHTSLESIKMTAMQNNTVDDMDLHSSTYCESETSGTVDLGGLTPSAIGDPETSVVYIYNKSIDDSPNNEVEKVRLRKANSGLSWEIVREVESLNITGREHLTELEEQVQQILNVTPEMSPDIDVGVYSPPLFLETCVWPDLSPDSDMEIDIVD